MTSSASTPLAPWRAWLQRHPLVLPCLILLVGAFFRYFNPNWDNGHQLHPDERWIYEVVSGAGGNPPLQLPSSLHQFFDITPKTGSPLDPHFFAYGSLPFYLLALVAAVVSFIGTHVPGLSGWSAANTYTQLPLIGRPLSATLDLLTVTLVYVLGRRVYGYWTAVLGMALAAFTVLDIQLSHFYAVDTVLVPLCLLVLLAAVHIAQCDHPAPYIWGGMALGAALATKTTALLLVIPLGLAPILAAWNSATWTGSFSRPALTAHYMSIAPRLNRDLQRLLLTFLIGAATFALGEPYAILDRAQLVSDIAQQSAFLVTNSPPFQVPYTIQYAHTIPYLYQLKNMLWWDLGLPLAAAAFAGVLSALLSVRRWLRQPEVLILLAWVIPYFLFVGSFFAKFSRYMLPIIPVMVLMGAALLVRLTRLRPAHRTRLSPRLPRIPFPRSLAWSALVAVTALSFLYSLAYMNIYQHPNTRVAASRWIFSHIPAGTTLAVETPWDDPLPLDESGKSAGQYRYIDLDLYAADGPAKVANLTNALVHAQYIVISSLRMTATIPKLPATYPVTIRYYHLLFSNKLNFRLVREFQQHPQLGPVVVHDYPADESFHVYDHPLVRIFKRVAPITPSQVAALLAVPAAPTSESIAPSPAPHPANSLLLSPSMWHADASASTLDSMFPPAGFAMHHPILVWLLALELLGLLAFPLVLIALPRLADAGFALSKTIGLVVLAYPIWLLVSLGVSTYTRTMIDGALVLLLLGATALAYLTRLRIRGVVREHWRAILTGEAIFLVGFALFVLLRMWYPDLGHQFSPVSLANSGSGRMGEKQMELAYLNAVVRSRVFPPYDPFFAHGYINYYYYGFYLVGTLCKITQIMPATGFNLAIATFFALLVANCFSAVLTLTRSRAAGILAAVFVGLFANLNGAWQVITGLISVGSLHSDLPLFGGVVDALSGVQAVLLSGAQLPAFDFWAPTRIVPPVGAVITEFPYFTFLFADLHPHLIAYPLDAAAVCLAVSVLLGAGQTRASFAATVVVGSILLGAIAVTNPWDFPTYLLVAALGALAASWIALRRLHPRLLLRPAIWGSSLAVLSAALYIPFKLHYETVFQTGIGLSGSITSEMLTANSLPASLLHDAQVTPLLIYLEHFGFFLYILSTFLFLLLMQSLPSGARPTPLGTHARFLWYYRDRLPRVLRAGRAVAAMRILPPPDPAWFLGWLVLAGGLWLAGDSLLAFLATAILLTAFVTWRLRARLDASTLFVLLLLLVPLLLSLGTQIFYVKDWLADGPNFRMNTIFKFYNQAWLLFALTSAVALLQVARTLTSTTRNPSGGQPDRIPLPRPRLALMPATSTTPPVEVSFVTHRAPLAAPPQTNGRISLPAALSTRAPWWTLGLLVLTLASLVYLYAGTFARETYRQSWLPERAVPFTLDGSAFMKVAYPQDDAGIAWLNAHVSGVPVIAEAANGFYEWPSRVSMFTGLPDIVNGNHEPEQRWGDEVSARQSDVATLYSTTNIPQARTIIRKYDVRYIFVGFSERRAYPSGLPKFEKMVGHGLTVAFHRPGVTIYRVTHP